MKKLLGILAAFSLVATSSIAVVSCNIKNNDQIKVADIKKATSHIKNKSDIDEVNQELLKVKIDGVQKLEAFKIENNKTDVTIKISIVEGRTIDEDRFILRKAIIDNDVDPEGEYVISFEEYMKNFSTTPGAESKFDGDWNIDYWDISQNDLFNAKSNSEIKQYFINNTYPQTGLTWQTASLQQILLENPNKQKWKETILTNSNLWNGNSVTHGPIGEDAIFIFKDLDFYDSQKTLDTPAKLNGEEISEVDGYYEVSMTAKAIEYLKEANKTKLLEYFDIDVENTEAVNDFNDGFNIFRSIKINFVIIR